MKSKKFSVAVIGYLAMILCTEILRAIVGLVGDYGSVPETSDFVWSILSQVVGMYGIPLAILFLAERPKPRTLIRELGYRATPKWWVYLASIGLAILMIPVITGFSVIGNAFILMTGGMIPTPAPSVTNNVGLMIGALFFSAVLPAVCEEGLHRGILIRGMRPHFKDLQIILLSALLFSLMHSYIRQTLYTFVFGLLLGTLTVKLGSIWPAMIIHFVNNAYAVYSDYATTFGWFGSGFFNRMDALYSDLMSSSFFGAAAIWLILIAAVAGVAWLLIRYGRKKEPPTPDFDAQTGLPLFNRTQVVGWERVLLPTAIFAGTLFTLFTYLAYLI